jgi:hypothetical protein
MCFCFRIAINQEDGVLSGQAEVPAGYDCWVLKFDGVDDLELGMPKGYGRIEYAYYLMGKAAGINMTECRLDRIVDFSPHDVFIGKIVQTYADESVLSGGKVVVSQLKPLLFDMSSKKYWALGNEIAKCWNIGKQIKTVRWDVHAKRV